MKKDLESFWTVADFSMHLTGMTALQVYENLFAGG
jgi:hypothetical protein